jgi:aminoglycoside phosphotransferase family enzyme
MTEQTRPAPTLEAKLAFLTRPASYPGTVVQVEAIETHMAWVFLAGERAYKLKKPVRYPFLDYSTLEARARICEEEVRLNRRLAPHVYLGRLPVVQQADGALSLGGEGTPVEWLVEMRRLRRARMLDHAVATRPVGAGELLPAASLLADFFAQAEPEPLDPSRYLSNLREDVTGNCDGLTRSALTRTDASAACRISEALLSFLGGHGDLLLARAREGRIIEGHGDLRPEHVYLGPPAAVIDCIEFSRRFRVLDPADELAFLSLELERLGAPAHARTFLETYQNRTGERVPVPLLHFYAAERALLRARLAIEHLADGGVQPARWIRRCHTYLRLATAHAERLYMPAGAERSRFPIMEVEVQWA